MVPDVSITRDKLVQTGELIRKIQRSLGRVSADYKYNGLNYWEAGEVDAVALTLEASLEILDGITDKMKERL